MAECKRLIHNLIGVETSLSNEEILSCLNDLLESIKDKKMIDMIKKYIEEIKSLISGNIEQYKQSREKQFCSTIKLDNKTTLYNSVLQDNLSPTMFAYYYRIKSRNILTDKEAAAIKSINMDNNFGDMEENKRSNNCHKEEVVK